MNFSVEVVDSGKEIKFNKNKGNCERPMILIRAKVPPLGHEPDNVHSLSLSVAVLPAFPDIIAYRWPSISSDLKVCSVLLNCAYAEAK